MGPILVSYLRAGEAGAAAWETIVRVDDTGSSRVPWPGEEGLARGRED